MSILRIRDDQGNVTDIPAIRGEKGDKGDKGDTGSQGPRGLQGEKGDKGDTPKKGVDYFTESDKSAMIDEVLKGIPFGDEVAY